MRENKDENDEVIGRIVEALRVLPAVPADATARVLARVDAARRGEDPSAYASSDDDVIFFPTSTEEMRASPARGESTVAPVSGGASTASDRGPRRLMVSLPAAIGYALAATLAGFLIRGALPRSGSETTMAVAPTPVTAESLGGRIAVVPAAASRRALQEAPVKVQFVLDAKRARSVAVVGDFNAWDGNATPLERDSTTGVWSALVDVRPGRHLYAFLVDGTVWTLDPNAPRAKDSDYGTEQSVMLVGLQ